MGVTKNQYIGGTALKGGGAHGQFADLKGACRRRGGGVFEGEGPNQNLSIGQTKI